MKVFLCGLLCASMIIAVSSNKLSLRSGSEEAKDGQFPYQMSLRTRNIHRCSGSIIDATTIISSAHCVHGYNASYINIVVGTNKLNSTGESYKAKSIISHKDYDYRTNDISIIKLASPIKFNDKIQLVELDKDYIEGDEDAIHSGWITPYEAGPAPNNLQYINVKTLFSEKLNDSVIENEIYTFTKGNEDKCYGDYGGPLVNSKGKLIGIVTMGPICSRIYSAGYTRISSYLDWIEDNRY